MRPLSFCHLTTFYPPHNFGGDGIGVQRLCRGLARRGHRVTVVHETDAYTALSPRPPAAAEPEPDGIEVVRLASRAPRLSLLLTQQLGRPVVNRARLERLLAAGRFDVINYHNVSLVGGPGLFALGDAAKLYMAHEHWLVCPSHVLWRHGRELCTGRECLRCVLHHGRPPQLWRSTGALARLGKHVDTFIAMSEFSRAKHAEFGFPFDMTVLPYFLPDPAPGAEAPGRPDGEPPHPRPYFLFVGRLELIKGLDDVIPLFERFEGADLVVCGTGEHEDALRRLAGDNPRVHFKGRVPQEQLERYYAHARALIVPSVCYETFGIILIEAFRAGTPVIARRLGPFPEIVEHARAGALFSDAQELEAALSRLLAEPEERDAMARRGWRAYRDTWSESAVLPRYEDVAREALERRGARARS